MIDYGFDASNDRPIWWMQILIMIKIEIDLLWIDNACSPNTCAGIIFKINNKEKDKANFTIAANSPGLQKNK